MSTPINPFNPFSFWAAALGGTTASRDTTRIAIKPRNSDPGLKVTSGKDSITIRGRTLGFKHVESFMGDYELARGMSFTLDIDKAKTTDSLGRTNYTEKNARLFTLDTAKGWSAEESARRLADKVNDGRAPFRAKVSVAGDGAATITFTRR